MIYLATYLFIGLIVLYLINIWGKKNADTLDAVYEHPDIDKREVKEIPAFVISVAAVLLWPLTIVVMILFILVIEKILDDK